MEYRMWPDGLTIGESDPYPVHASCGSVDEAREVCSGLIRSGVVAGYLPLMREYAVVLTGDSLMSAIEATSGYYDIRIPCWDESASRPRQRWQDARP